MYNNTLNNEKSYFAKGEELECFANGWLTSWTLNDAKDFAKGLIKQGKLFKSEDPNDFHIIIKAI